jgi:hypothetical protein
MQPGKPQRRFEKDLQLLYDKDCNIIVCAGKTSVKAFEFIEQYRDSNYTNDPFRIYEIPASNATQVKKYLNQMV